MNASNTSCSILSHSLPYPLQQLPAVAFSLVLCMVSGLQGPPLAPLPHLWRFSALPGTWPPPHRETHTIITTTTTSKCWQTAQCKPEKQSLGLWHSHKQSQHSGCGNGGTPPIKLAARAAVSVSSELHQETLPQYIYKVDPKEEDSQG